MYLKLILALELHTEDMSTAFTANLLNMFEFKLKYNVLGTFTPILKGRTAGHT